MRTRSEWSIWLGRQTAPVLATNPGPTRQKRENLVITRISSRPPTLRTRWWRFFLAAIAAALVALLGAGTASATTLPEVETRVGASTPVVRVVVGPHDCITAGQRWCHAPPQAQTVVGCCVAAGTGMLGTNGTQTFSTTLTKPGLKYRIDVENPAPGVRPGQRHFQQGNAKYLYDFDAGAFIGMPIRMQKVIARDPNVARAIEKGRSVLGLE